jgi:hypothetical protein
MPLTAEPCSMQCVKVVNGKWLCRVSRTIEQQTDFPRHSFWFSVGASRDENDRCNTGIAVGRNLPKCGASSMSCPDLCCVPAATVGQQHCDGCTSLSYGRDGVRGQSKGCD